MGAARGHWRQCASKSALTDSPSWIRLMASARAAASEMTCSFGPCSVSGIATVLVQTISRTSGWADIRLSAPPVKVALTAEEQYSYMSMWALMASPLFYSGDMGSLDEFTLNVLCNAEVIDVDQ